MRILYGIDRILQSFSLKTVSLETRFYFTYKSLNAEKRVASIYRPSKNPMQSGVGNTKEWRLEFDVLQKWENPLIGWASGADPYQSSALFFDTLEEAIRFCDKQELKYEVKSPTKKRLLIRPYASKFSWDKPTRCSTK